MKIIRANELFKGLLLIIAGLVIAILPGFISSVFYTIGIIIILFNAILLIIGYMNNPQNITASKHIFGIITGAVIFFFPKLLSFGLPVIIGISICIFGFEKLIKAVEMKKISDNKWIIHLIISTLSIIIGLYFVFNPFKISTKFRILIGIIIIILGCAKVIYNYKFSNSQDDSGIVDIDKFTIRDEKQNKLK